MLDVFADLDYTTVDPRGWPFFAYGAGFAKLLGVKYPKKVLPTGITAPDRIRQNLAEAGLPTDIDTVMNTVRCISDTAVQYQQLWRDKVQPMPGAVELLRRLHIRSGIRVSTVTANMKAVAQVKIDAVGMSPFIDPTTSAFGEEGETRADLVRLALRRAQAQPADAVVLGDTVQDILAARGAGVRVVAVVSEVDGRAALEDAGPDVLLDDLTDTDAVLDALLGHVPARSLVAA